MQVLCIESEKGEGVYAIGAGYKCSRAAMHERATAEIVTELWHPSPEDEPKLRDFWLGTSLSRKHRIKWPDNGRREWFCGFEDTTQLLQWFPIVGLEHMAYWDNIRNHNIRICVYEIHGSKVLHGDHQIIFKKKEAKLLSFVPISKFLLDAEEDYASIAA